MVALSSNVNALAPRIIAGTCGACHHYDGECCQRPGSTFEGRNVWRHACLDCTGYSRSEAPITPVDPAALAAVRH